MTGNTAICSGISSWKEGESIKSIHFSARSRLGVPFRIPANSTCRKQAPWLVMAALGGIYNERAGVMNIGMEGMMLMGSLIGFTAVLHEAERFRAIVTGTLAALRKAAARSAISTWTPTCCAASAG